MEALGEDKISALRNELEIMQLIYHRNHNQHRQARWWRYFKLLKKNVYKLVNLLNEWETSKRKTEVHTQIIELCRYLHQRKVVTRVYYEVNTILALGQFIALGFALLAMLARVRAIILEIEGVERAKEQMLVILIETHGLVDEIGEEIKEETANAVPKPQSLDTPVAKVPKKKKKKKSKSAMDDIFGF